MAYNRDFVAPTLQRRKPQGGEGAALKELDAKLAALPADASPDDIQNIVYEIGKNEAHGFENLRDWFKALYETLLGSSAGTRMGSFIARFAIGRASCRERVGPYGDITVVDVSLKKKQTI